MADETKTTTETETTETEATNPAESTDWKAEARKWEKRAKDNRTEADALKEQAAEAEKAKAELEELKEQMESERVSHALELAGVRNVKAALPLLAEHDGDIGKLKEAEPWLFAEAIVHPTRIDDGGTSHASAKKTNADRFMEALFGKAN